MYVIKARNVQQALPKALRTLDEVGYKRDSRNGPVLISPCPVTTIYEKPMERVLFWKERDANPFFHLYEALWMLAGRNDVAGVVRYAKQMAEYSDDGETLHGAYGYRWRNWFTTLRGPDQLTIIAETLRSNPDDRRCVLQMWDVSEDLGLAGKDFPCNLTATFQRDQNGRLDLTVFCRSNDIIWGCYGANAVHFSVLLDYMAAWVGCPVGVYRQVSVNWHAYLSTLEGVVEIPRHGLESMNDPYSNAGSDVHPVSFAPISHIIQIDQKVQEILNQVDDGFPRPTSGYFSNHPILQVAYWMLRAHHLWKTLPAPERYEKALDVLQKGDPTADWIVAGIQWMNRRQTAWEAKMVIT